MPDAIPLQYRPIYDLSGGMVTNWNFTKVAPNQYIRLLNGDVSNDGAVTKRKGRIKLLNTAFAGNAKVDSLFSFGVSGTAADLIFASSNGTLREVSTGAEVSVKTGLAVGVKLRAQPYSNYMFFVNGTNTPFMTQGAAATTYQVGITPPANLTGFVPAEGAADNSTAGTHRFTLRYRSTITGARSNPPISGTTITSVSLVAAGSKTYSLTFPVGLVSADPQVDQIDYFIQEANAAVSAPYYYLGSSANANGVYVFSGLIDDPSLIIKERLDIDDNVASSAFRDIIQWRGRLLCIASDYTVQYSKVRVDANSFVNLPTSWPAGNGLFVGYGDGDPLVKLVIVNDMVLAFKRRSVWALQGDFDANNFGFSRLKVNLTNIGLLNPDSICIVGEAVYFVTDDLKFRAFSPTDVSFAELRVTEPPISDRIADLFGSFASANRTNVVVVNYSFAQYTQVWIGFSDGASGFAASQNFNLFVFDYSANGGVGAWHIHTGIELASSTLAKDINGDYFVYSGDYFGFVWKHNLTDGDGAEVNSTSTGSNGAATFNDTNQVFTTAVDVGLFITIIDGTGSGQVRRISAVNTPTQLAVATAWTIVPDNTSAYTIGGIDFQLWSRFDWLADDAPYDFDKYGWYIDLDVELSGAFSYDVAIVKDRLQNLQSISHVSVTAGGSFWGIAIWGFDVWSALAQQYGQVGLDILFKQIGLRITNPYAGQFLKVNGWTFCYQLLEHIRPQ